MRLVRNLLVVVFFILALLPAAAGAQKAAECGGPIGYGDEMACDLSQAEGDRWTFDGAEGDVISIEMNSEDFDTYVELYGPGDELVAFNDDGPSGTDAVIDSFELPEAGTYTILAGGFGGETGAYVLRLGWAAPEAGERGVGMPNPASVYCEEHGGRVDIREDDQGNQYGVCVFPEGGECEEWAYYRGECHPAGELPEEDALRIAYGDTLEGELAADEGDVWRFDGEKGDVVSIAMNSDEFDAYLELYGPDGEELASDDDGGSGYNASISEVELPETGAYTIVASSWGGESGPYEISLVPGGEGPSPDELSIAYGETMSADLASEDGDIWLFEGEEGDVVTIAMDSDAFDAYLTLYDPNGDELDFDDDGGSGYNALISEVELPETGSYAILASSWGGETGPYELSLASVGGRGPRPEQRLAYGDTVTADLGSEDGDIWLFEGEEGDVVTIEMTSEDFDAYLELDGPDGDELISDDDSGSGNNARIGRFGLPETGTYGIIAASWGGEMGEYELSLATGEGPSPEAGTIAYGEIVEGELTDEGAAWQFEGEEGDVVTIALDSDDFDAYLELDGPDGDEVMADDDSGGEYNALIEEFELPESGVYTIMVYAWEGETGAYELSLEGGTATPPPEAGTITYGETVEGELTEDGAAWQFEGEEGDVVTIALDSDDFDAYLELDGPDGDEVMADDDSGDGYNALIEEFELPESGVYTIMVYAWEGETGAYELSLEGSTSAGGERGTNEPAAESIEYGQIVEGALSSEESAAWQFEGEEGDIVTIVLNSEDFDVYLELDGPDGDEAASDDDSGAGANALISEFELPASGTYTILVYSWGGKAGSYSLSLEVTGSE